MQESIYNLIQKEYVPPAKEKHYRSKFPGVIPPTASTFCLKTTSSPKVSNIEGYLNWNLKAHQNMAESATFGRPKEAVLPHPDNFLKKGLGNSTLMTKSDANQTQEHEASGLKRDCLIHNKRDPVPKRDERPVHGLISSKNFIISNAVENILSTPKALPEEKNFLKKRNYGEVPTYLSKINEELSNQYRIHQELQLQEEKEKEQKLFRMSEEEVNKLRDGLQKKWEAVHKEYQNITHITKIDTVGLRRKKETCEKELASLQKDYQRFTKNYVFVDSQK